MNNLSALYKNLKKKHGYSNGDELNLIVVGLLRNNQRSRILIDLLPFWGIDRSLPEARAG